VVTITTFDGSQKGIVNLTVFDKEKMQTDICKSCDMGDTKIELVSKNERKKTFKVDDETSSKHSKVNSTFDITDVSSNEGNNVQKNDHTSPKGHFRFTSVQYICTLYDAYGLTAHLLLTLVSNSSRRRKHM
jgi:hypothetical protein